jgi:hypothetical protein
MQYLRIIDFEKKINAIRISIFQLHALFLEMEDGRGRRGLGTQMGRRGVVWDREGMVSLTILFNQLPIVFLSSVLAVINI